MGRSLPAKLPRVAASVLQGAFRVGGRRYAVFVSQGSTQGKDQPIAAHVETAHFHPTVSHYVPHAQEEAILEARLLHALCANQVSSPRMGLPTAAHVARGLTRRPMLQPAGSVPQENTPGSKQPLVWGVRLENFPWRVQGAVVHVVQGITHKAMHPRAASVPQESTPSPTPPCAQDARQASIRMLGPESAWGVVRETTLCPTHLRAWSARLARGPWGYRPPAPPVLLGVSRRFLAL